MRIENNTSFYWRAALELNAIILAVALTGSCAYAANPAAPGMPPDQANSAMNADVSVPPPLPMPASPAGAMGAPSADNGKPEIAKNVTAMENKISDGAKAVVKNLDASADAMTLEDLNSARQTIARIDALIDIEKHLADLEKVRNERTGTKSTSSFASVIPASALQPPPSTAMKAPEPVQIQLPPKPIAPNVELARITGTDGHYSAVLRVNGDLKTFAIGDQVSSHETIKYISLSTVVLEDNGQPHTLHIKGVDAIYNAMR